MSFQGTHALAPTDTYAPDREKAYRDTESPDDDDNGGNYECVVCGYQTDIPNEHATHARNWCQGDCHEITTFKQTTDD